MFSSCLKSLIGLGKHAQANLHTYRYSNIFYRYLKFRIFQIASAHWLASSKFNCKVNITFCQLFCLNSNMKTFLNVNIWSNKFYWIFVLCNLELNSCWFLSRHYLLGIILHYILKVLCVAVFSGTAANAANLGPKFFC